MNKFKPLGNCIYYTEELITDSDERINNTFDNARLKAELGIEQMYEIACRLHGHSGWKTALIKKVCKAAFKLIHKL